MFKQLLFDTPPASSSVLRDAVLVVGTLLWLTGWGVLLILGTDAGKISYWVCWSVGPLVWIAVALGYRVGWRWAARWLVACWFAVMTLSGWFSELAPASVLLNYVAMVAFAGWALGLRSGLVIAALVIVAAVAFQFQGNSTVPATLALVHCTVLMLWVLFQVHRQASERIAEVEQHASLLEVQSKQLRLLSQAIEATPECVAIVDYEGRLVYVNKTFERQCGISRAEAIGCRSIDISTSGLQDGDVHRQMREIVDQGEIWTSTLYNRRSDGQLVIESVSIAPVLDTDGRVTHFIEVKRDLRERMENERRIDRLQNQDEVTQLPNRSALLRQLDGLLKQRGHQRWNVSPDTLRWHGLALLHMERFNDYQDASGLAWGETVRRAVAHQLEGLIPSNAWLASPTPESFALVFEYCGHGAQQALRNLQSLALKLRSEGFTVDAPPVEPNASSDNARPGLVQLGCSIGLVIFSPDDPKVAEGGASHVLQGARVALAQAQRFGGGQMHLYPGDLVESAQRRLRLETDLYSALLASDSPQLTIYVQPQADWTGRIASAEALARWNHPELGWITPAEFISVAESSGLIGLLGDWVLKQVCQLLAQPEVIAGGYSLSANVSPLQLAQPEFVPRLESLLRETGIRPASLTLEITESALMGDVDATIVKLQSILQLGVQIALDDFGSGYSSLSYLKQLPLHEVKIDQSFIRGMDPSGVSGALVEAVLMVAHRKNLRVVAEGVEAEDEAVLLRALDPKILCQGYWVSRPMPVEQWLADPQLGHLTAVDGVTAQ